MLLSQIHASLEDHVGGSAKECVVVIWWQLGGLADSG